MPLFPLSTVLFPDGVLPLQVFEVRYLDMISRCLLDETPFGVVLLTQGHEVRRPGAEQERFVAAGTVASVTETTATTPGLLQVLCRGGSRFSVVTAEQRINGLWMAEAELVEDDHEVPVPSELQGAADALDRVLASLHTCPSTAGRCSRRSGSRIAAGWRTAGANCCRCPTSRSTRCSCSTTPSSGWSCCMTCSTSMD